MTPKISIILRTRQQSSNLSQAVESVLAQAYTNFELFILNDSNQDANRAILDTYLDRRITVIETKGGEKLSRNLGIEKATGDYLAFIDADDYWTVDKLAIQVDALEKNPEAIVAYGWADRVDHSGETTQLGNREIHEGYVYQDLLLSNFLQCRSNALIKLESLRKIGGLDDKLKVTEDWDMYLRLATEGVFICCERLLSYYRISEEETQTPITVYEQTALQMLDRLFSNPRIELSKIRSLILGNLNKSLLVEALDQARHENAFVALRMLVNAVRHDPNLWRQRIVWRVLIKICHMIVLPQPLMALLSTNFRLFKRVEFVLTTVAPAYHKQFAG